MKQLLARLLASLLGAIALPAFAADVAMPKFPIRSAAAPPAPPSPLYIFGQVGLGLTDVENDIALPGLAAGSPKLWPAGAMVGGGLGYLSTIGPLVVGGEVEANYDFTRASLGCTGLLPCMGESKNSWFFAERLLAGFTLSQFAGYIPGGVQPASWPVPITVPASFWSNIMILGGIGAAQRNVDLCALDLATGNSLCGSQWKNGLDMAAQLRFQVSANSSIRATYDFIDYKQTWTPQQSIPLFANTIAAKNQQRMMIGYEYHF